MQVGFYYNRLYNPYGYSCVLSSSANITTLQDVLISSITGNHFNDRTNRDVYVFTAFNQKVFYFPQGLDKFFQNIMTIEIVKCGLKEIHGSDIKVFSNLSRLDLNGNRLEFLEGDLFNFNPQIKSIYLNGNRISQVDPKFFDSFGTRAVILNLLNNECLDVYMMTPAQIQYISKRISKFCPVNVLDSA